MLIQVWPEKYTAFEIAYFIFKLLGVVTFIAWPAVLIADVMSIAGAPSSAPLTFNDQLFRIFIYVSLIYPLIFIAIYIAADRIKMAHPFLALIIAALPAAGVYGVLGYNLVRSKIHVRQSHVLVDGYARTMRFELAKGEFTKAFSLFLDPKNREAVALIEALEDSPFDLRQMIESSVPLERVNGELVSQMLKYIEPTLHGSPSVHIVRLPSRSLVYLSNDLIELLGAWKAKGLKPQGLSEAEQWFYDRIEVFARPQREALENLAKSENAFLSKLINYLGPDVATWAAKEALVDSVGINLQGKFFGTPLYAHCVEYAVSPGNSAAEKIQFLINHGAKFGPGESTPEMSKALTDALANKSPAH